MKRRRLLIFYKPISDYGVIGNLRTAALVAKDGSIDWACLPDFDSPAVFAALLDAERGGSFHAFVPGAETSTQSYVARTNVLSTRFLHPEGIGEVEDFMPIGAHEANIVRMLRTVRGRLRFAVDCRPAPDYARAQVRLLRHEDRVEIGSDGLSLELICPGHVEFRGSRIHCEVELSEGESAPVILRIAGSKISADRQRARCESDLSDTVAFWRDWLARADYRGRWSRELERSALILKLLTHRPSGAIAAAVTSSLPERIGECDNWDYRLCWVRDACWTVDVFMHLGYQDEARAFMAYLRRMRRLHSRSGEPLDVLYPITDATLVAERTLEHFAGYRGSTPVRIGNAASEQRQLDVYGEFARAALLYDRNVEPIGEEDWHSLVDMAGWLAQHAGEPDSGIWEERGPPRQFVQSKVQAWAALDCTLRLAERRGFPLDGDVVRRARARLEALVLDRGYDARSKTFREAFDGDGLDVATLFLQFTGLLKPRDVRLLSTVDRIQSELCAGALVRRNSAESNAFCIGSFWLVEALANMGRLDEAETLFERMLTHANHLGLYSEEIDGSGRQVGNFPQALTHVGLIRAVLALQAE